jgi:RND family efflux transporter MFP subunit
MQIEATELQIAQTENQMAALNKQIAMARILAPFGGTIMEKAVEMGSFLSPGTPVATIVDVSRLKLNVKLTEAEVLRVRTGMPVRVTCPLYPDASFTGTVRSVAVRADASMNYLVEIDVPNSAQHPLRAGMDGWAYFGDNRANARTALAIRRDAIMGGLQEPKVYVVQGGVARLRSIRTGLAAGSYVEVTQGLAPGDAIVVAGQINLVDSSRVIVSQ